MTGTQRQLVPVSLPSGWDADDKKFDLAHEAMIERMHRDGYVWFKQGSHSAAMRLKELLGESLYVTHVKENTQSKSLLSKKKSLAPHTDHHAVDFVLWYVHDHCEEGGETHLYPTKDIVLKRRLRSWALSLECKEHKIFEDDPGIWPVIQYAPTREEKARGPLTLYRGENNGLWYYSFWLANARTERHEKAFKLLQEKIEQTEPLRGHLKKGDIFIFDNRLNLHARTEYFDSKRHLERHWVKGIL